MLQERCPVCLCVMLVCCSQTVGWIKLPLGTEVVLGLGDIVLDGDPAPPPTERAQQPPSHYSARLLWPNRRPSQQLPSSCLLPLVLEENFEDKCRRFYGSKANVLSHQPSSSKQQRKRSRSVCKNVTVVNVGFGRTVLASFLSQLYDDVL